MNRLALIALAGTLSLTACDSAEPEPVALTAQLAADVEADLTTGRNPTTGQPISNNQFTLFDLDAGETVLLSSETDDAVRRADSTGTAWDIGFRGTTIIFNGGTSGPGSVRAQLLPSTLFAELAEAPEGGYLADGENTCPAAQTPGGTVPGARFVVCTGSDNGWYNYNGAQNLVSPLPGRTIAVRTSEGDYAKLRILSYYRGNPAAPVTDPSDPNASASRYYTFEYVVQPDGSRGFETTTPDA